MKKNSSYYIRRTHRYLGIIIGIQFLGWTISGLYFSWNNIDDVHGDHMRKSPRFISADISTVAPSVAISNLKESKRIDSIHSIRLIQILKEPVYQISYFAGHAGDGVHHHVRYSLASASTGDLREPLSREEAIAVAKEHVLSNATLQQAELIEKTNKHHEYRGRELPVWAVTFNHPNCTVYVSPQLGTFQTIRHNQWRIFDFLWMFHTMDYEGRDNFNNILLKSFSVFGLVTILSGFVLFVVSSPAFKKNKSKKRKTADQQVGTHTGNF